MEAALLVVVLLIVAALAVAFGSPYLGHRTSRTLVIERPVSVRPSRLRRVVRTEHVDDDVIDERL